MKLYQELERTIEDVINTIDEEEDFKRRFKCLINKYYERSFGTQDLEDTIELVKLIHNEEDL